MTCHNCEIRAGKYGKDRNGTQRYRCKGCGKTFLQARDKPLGEMRIPMEKAVQALKCLVEGCSIRSTARLTGLEKKTILRLLVLVGKKAERILDSKVRNVDCPLIQADEIWSFVNKKQKKLKASDPYEYGDQYTFVALDPSSKLVVSHIVGKRDGVTTQELIDDLKDRVAGRIQLSTDAFSPYEESVETAFGSDVDYAQVHKIYHADTERIREGYRPPRVIGIKAATVQGDPDLDLVSTSHVERNNLTIRMSMRRLTRLTNAFSKKLRNLKAAVAFHFCFYNFCRVHSSISVTPAMEAGITDHIWTVEELLKAA